MLSILKPTKKRIIIFLVLFFLLTLMQLSIGESPLDATGDLNYSLILLGIYSFFYAIGCFFTLNEIKNEDALNENINAKNNNPGNDKELFISRLIIMGFVFIYLFLVALFFSNIDNAMARTLFSSILAFLYITGCYFLIRLNNKNINKSKGLNNKASYQLIWISALGIIVAGGFQLLIIAVNESFINM